MRRRLVNNLLLGSLLSNRVWFEEALVKEYVGVVRAPEPWINSLSHSKIILLVTISSFALGRLDLL